MNMSGEVSKPAEAPDNAGTAEAATPQPTNIREVYEAAWDESHPEGTGTEIPAVSPAEGTESRPEAADEPEHIKWAKSIDGDYDKATGKFVEDRILKRAFELHKQSQSTAQKIAGLTKILQHPDILPKVRSVFEGQSAKTAEPEKKPEELSDEEIFRKAVQDEARKIVEPLQKQANTLYQRHIEAETQSAYLRLKEEFGTDDDGASVYDKIRDDVGKQFVQAAAQMGVTPDQLIRALVERGQLYETFASTSRNILFPTLRQKTTQAAATAQAKKVEDLKRVRLPQRGTPAKQVSAKGREVKSFRDAVEEAEKELGSTGS
jgi:antitoxin component of RelBE/YafQ-DinJ toxin-antitoxin module